MRCTPLPRPRAPGVGGCTASLRAEGEDFHSVPVTAKAASGAGASAPAPPAPPSPPQTGAGPLTGPAAARCFPLRELAGLARPASLPPGGPARQPPTSRGRGFNTLPAAGGRPPHHRASAGGAGAADEGHALHAHAGAWASRCLQLTPVSEERLEYHPAVGFRAKDGSTSSNPHDKTDTAAAAGLKRRRAPSEEGASDAEGDHDDGSDEDDENGVDVEGPAPDAAAALADSGAEGSDVLPAWQAPARDDHDHSHDDDADDDATEGAREGLATRRSRRGARVGGGGADRAEDIKDSDNNYVFDDSDMPLRGGKAADEDADAPSLMAATADPDAELRRQAFGVPVAVPEGAAFFPDAGARLTVRLGAVMAGHKRDLHTCLKDGCACEGVFYKDFNCLKSAMLAVVSLHVTRVGADGQAPAGRPAAAVAAAWKALRAKEPEIQVRYSGEFAPVLVSSCDWVQMDAEDEGFAAMPAAERRLAGAWHVTFRPTTVTDRLNAMCCARVSVGFNIVDSGAFEIRTKPSEWMVLEGLPLAWSADKFNEVMAQVGPKGALVSTLLIPGGRKGCTGATGFARYASRIRAGEALFSWLECAHASEQAGEGGAIASLIQSLNRVFKDKPDGSGDLIAYGVRHPDDCRRGVVYAQVQVRLGPGAERAREVARRLVVTERVARPAPTGGAGAGAGAGAGPKGRGRGRGSKAKGKAKGKAAAAAVVASDSEDDEDGAGWGGEGRSKRARTVWDVTDPALAGPIEPTMPVPLAARDHFRPVHLLYSGAVGAFELPPAAAGAAGLEAAARAAGPARAKAGGRRRRAEQRVHAGALPPIDGEQSDYEDYDDIDSDAGSAPSPVASSPPVAAEAEAAFPVPVGGAGAGATDAGLRVASAEGEVSEGSLAPAMPVGHDDLMGHSGDASDSTASYSAAAAGAKAAAVARGSTLSRGYSFSGVAGRQTSGGPLCLGEAGALGEVDRLDAGLKACLADVPTGFSAAATGALDSGSEDERREAVVGFDAAFRDLLNMSLP